MGFKTLIIGLDGVPCSVIKELAHKGIMPYIKNLMEDSLWGAMQVCLPPLSSVSWSSFMTAKNPADHGIYGFTDITPDYKLHFNSFLDIKSLTLFDRLGEKGINSVVINLPSTYPTRAFPGVLISGFWSLDLEKSVYPPSLLPFLKEINYQVDIDLQRARKDPKYLFGALKDTLQMRKKLADYLWDREKWDLFMLVVTGTDRLQHYQFKSLINTEGKRYKGVMDYYKEIDKLIEYYVNLFKSQGGDMVIILSDHGFTELKKEVYINFLLEEKGFLKFKNKAPATISDLDPENSVAFALDPGRIYVNLKDRFMQGTVSKKDFDKVIEDLKHLFDSLYFEGEKVIKMIKMKEEVYSGKLIDKAPDMVLVSVDGFDLKGAVSGEGVFRDSDLEGMHTFDNAFYLIHTKEGSVKPPADIIELARFIEKSFLN